MIFPNSKDIESKKIWIFQFPLAFTEQHQAMEENEISIRNKEKSINFKLSNGSYSLNFSSQLLDFHPYLYNQNIE